MVGAETYTSKYTPSGKEAVDHLITLGECINCNFGGQDLRKAIASIPEPLKIDLTGADLEDSFRYTPKK